MFTYTDKWKFIREYIADYFKRYPTPISQNVLIDEIESVLWEDRNTIRHVIFNLKDEGVLNYVVHGKVGPGPYL